MSNFVQKRKPEIIQGVAQERHSDDRNVFYQEGGTINVHSRDLLLNDQHNPVCKKKLAGEAWSVIKPA